MFGGTTRHCWFVGIPTAWNCQADIVEALKQAGARPEPTARREPRQPQVEDFSVSVAYKGPHAPADLGSNPEAQTYRMRLEGAKKLPNFAGHYVMVEWGCGTESTVYLMVDVKNGKVFDVPQALMGGAFRNLPARTASFVSGLAADARA